MTTIKIEKVDEETTYIQKESTINLLINGKTVCVYVHENTEEGADYNIDKEDKETLTEEELEAFEDLAMWELAKEKDGYITNIEIDL